MKTQQSSPLKNPATTFSREMEPVDFQGSDRETKSGSEED